MGGYKIWAVVLGSALFITWESWGMVFACLGVGLRPTEVLWRGRAKGFVNAPRFAFLYISLRGGEYWGGRLHKCDYWGSPLLPLSP